MRNNGHHWPPLRLVVDNKSSSERSTPVSRAKRKRGKCHLPGIPLSGADQLDTALWRMPKRPAKDCGPPKRAMIDFVSMMGSSDITNSDAFASTNSDTAESPFSQHDECMADGDSSRAQDREIRAVIAQRVGRLFKESGESPTVFAKRMGLKYNAFKNRLDNESFAIHSVIRLAASLDVSMDFLCGLTDDPTPLSSEEVEPTFWQIRAGKAAEAPKVKKAAK